jgi:hypothetical protein
MLSFIKFLKESFLVESYREQLIGTIQKTREMAKQAQSKEEQDKMSRSFGVVQKQEVPGFGKTPILFASDSLPKRKNLGAFAIYPQTHSHYPGYHTIVFNAPKNLSTIEAMLRMPNAPYTIAHEVAHSWQGAKQQEKGSVDPDTGIPKMSGSPLLSRTIRHQYLGAVRKYDRALSPEESAQMSKLKDEIGKMTTTPNAAFNDYENSDLERNARAIAQGFRIYHGYRNAFEKASSEMPEATHDDVVQHVRSKLLASAREEERTLKPENQTKIGQRYAKSYADEHTKRIMIAIQHAEETHLPKLKHVKR